MVCLGGLGSCPGSSWEWTVLGGNEGLLSWYLVGFLVCVPLCIVPFLVLGSGFVSDIVWDWSLFLGMDNFFGDCWFLRDWQWGRLLVGICSGFLFVYPGYEKNWRSLATGSTGGAYVRERLRFCQGLATLLVGTGSSGIGLAGTFGSVSLLVGIGIWERDQDQDF